MGCTHKGKVYDPADALIRPISENLKYKMERQERWSMTSKLEGKLQDHAYRTAFVASQINVGIPFQIKALMKTRGWTQEKLAERTGMLQPRISAILRPGKVRLNIETLRRFAEAFDCGLLVRFAPFSELARWSDTFNPERFDVPAFKDDLGFQHTDGTAADHAARIPPQRQIHTLPSVTQTVSSQQQGISVQACGSVAELAAEPRRDNVVVLPALSAVGCAPLGAPVSARGATGSTR